MDAATLINGKYIKTHFPQYLERCFCYPSLIAHPQFLKNNVYLCRKLMLLEKDDATLLLDIMMFTGTIFFASTTFDWQGLIFLQPRQPACYLATRPGLQSQAQPSPSIFIRLHVSVRPWLPSDMKTFSFVVLIFAIAVVGVYKTIYFDLNTQQQ